MDKIIIVGGYEFLGFSLCTAFLDKGNSVDCIHFDNSHDAFYEEKRFSVGRNANFTELSIENWSKSELAIDENTVVMISFYDVFFKKDSVKLLEQFETEWKNILQSDKLNGSSLILLFPLQLIENAVKRDDTYAKMVDRVVGGVKEKNLPFQAVYLPTLYGPWQPMECLFQQVLLTEVKKEKDIEVTTKEWVKDAIYIEDAVNEILCLIDEEKLATPCILKSSEGEQWKKCADFLGIKPELYHNIETATVSESEFRCIVIKDSIGVVQGLTLQKQHLLRILSGV